VAHEGQAAYDPKVFDIHIEQPSTKDCKFMSIETQVREYLAQNVLFSNDSFEYDNDASFLEEGIIDSVAIMDFVLFIEETYNIQIEDHEITPDHFDSVKQNSSG
jgi:acyl carrier protein